MGELQPSQMRISDADRHRVEEILRQAAGDGRIDLDELDERLDAVFKAKTYGELVPITADIVATSAQPSAQLGAQPPIVAGRSHGTALAIMGGVDRKGVWTVPRTFTVAVIMGGADLDLRQAQFSAPEVTLVVNTVMGGANIIVNRNTQVIMGGIGIMGGFTGPRSDARLQLDAGSPVVHVKGVAIMGGVTVQRKAMPGEETAPGWRRRH